MWLGGAHEYFEEGLFQRRLKIISALVLVCYFIIGTRLFALQVLQGEQMAQISERNHLQLIFLRAPRGRILDAQGVPLIQDGPSFTLFYSPASVSSQEVQRKVENHLVGLLSQDSYQVKKKLAESHRVRQYVRIAEDITRKNALELVEEARTLPGVSVAVEAKRRYASGYVGSHLVGYLGELSREELTRPPFVGFRMGDLAGLTGVEKLYDHFLRGRNGGLEIEINSSGRQVRLVRRVEPQIGREVLLTIDLKVQKAAEEALAQTETGRGAVVALDPRTGAVLALASAPAFDASRLRNALEDDRLPLFNRAIQGVYAPGSCFKMVTMLAALKEGVVKPGTRFRCAGSYDLGKRVFRCWKPHGHGWSDLYQAMAQSCDVYFYQVAERIRAGELEAMAHQFGLGEPTKIDLPGEASGVVPGPLWSERQKKPWYTGDTLNYSIGQGQLLVTPLQAAVMMSAVASRGVVYQPYVVKEVLGAQEDILYQAKPIVLRKIELDSSLWDILERSLLGVVQAGTGQQAAIPGWTVFGKTGTAQNPQGEDHAWFVAAAGKDLATPSVVVAALVENGGHGGVAAVPVAKRVLQAALGIEVPGEAHAESPAVQ